MLTSDQLINFLKNCKATALLNKKEGELGWVEIHEGTIENLIDQLQHLSQENEQLNKDLKKAYYQGREHGEGNAEIRQDLITDNARLLEENNALKKQLEGAIVLKNWLLTAIINKKAGNNISLDTESDCENYGARSFCQSLLARYDNFRREAEAEAALKGGE